MEKTKILSSESRLCAVRLKEPILPGVAKGQQRGDLIGAKGIFALQEGSGAATDLVAGN